MPVSRKADQLLHGSCEFRALHVTRITAQAMRQTDMRGVDTGAAQTTEVAAGPVIWDACTLPATQAAETGGGVASAGASVYQRRRNLSAKVMSSTMERLLWPTADIMVRAPWDIRDRDPGSDRQRLVMTWGVALDSARYARFLGHRV